MSGWNGRVHAQAIVTQRAAGRRSWKEGWREDGPGRAARPALPGDRGAASTATRREGYRFDSAWTVSASVETNVRADAGIVVAADVPLRMSRAFIDCP